jgi:hypothetical protein
VAQASPTGGVTRYRSPMGDQPERVTIDGKEYVLAGPTADAKYAGLYSMNGKWYRVENGEATFVPMSGWQRRSAGTKAVIIFGVVVGGIGLLWLLTLDTDGSSSSSSSGGNSDIAGITLSGSCESGECDIVYDNATGGSDAIDGVPAIVEKFDVSNEEYEIYSISVRDGDGGEAKCSAALTVDQEIVERDTATSNGTTAYCNVSTLIN